MPTLHELLAQHTLVNEQYTKLFATNQAVTQRLRAARLARSALRQQLHGVIGVLSAGTLVMNHKGTRFHEIVSLSSGSYYGTHIIYQTNGERKTPNGGTPYMAVVEAGSVLPVPPTHTVYLKWQKRRLRDTLEGKE